MNAVPTEPSIERFDTQVPATSTRNKVLAILEVSAVFALIMVLLVALASTDLYRWEKEHLGWSYTGMMIYVGIPIAVVWLTRRNWAEYGVSSADWQTNLDIGIKAFLVAFIPLVVGVGGAMQWAG